MICHHRNPAGQRNTFSVETAFHDFQRGFTTFAIVVRIFWLFSDFSDLGFFFRYFLGSFCISHRQPYPLAWHRSRWQCLHLSHMRADWLIFDNSLSAASAGFLGGVIQNSKRSVQALLPFFLFFFLPPRRACEQANLVLIWEMNYFMLVKTSRDVTGRH